jgi:hypothetical protein
MFEPGHLHRASLPGDTPCYAIDLYYQVRGDPVEGKVLELHMSGVVEGRPFEERFTLHQDTAFNFASVASRLASRHGLPAEHGLILTHHDEYDRMFADIREKLDARAGDPINLDHVEKDRP